jgi:ATP/maltotriose-dependent transcriptional regulator MalT
VSTVKWYLRAIYDKLGSANRTQAVARARALGLLQ